MRIEKKLLQKYIAIKPSGFKTYIWFSIDKVSYDDFYFQGIGGWGKDGEFTNIHCKIDEISSIIHSNVLQY